jgi:quinol monooxygenase YgiN
MSKVGVIAVAVAAPGRADAVADRLKRAVTAMHAEGGTEIYSVHRDAKDERTFWFFELYTDRAAMVEHARGDALRELLAELEPLLEKGSEIHVVVPQAAKGLAI